VNRTLPTLLMLPPLLLATAAGAQQVATAVSRPVTPVLPRGQAVIDIITVTRHPAFLEPSALNVPEGARILISTASPDNARTCARGAPIGSECRQTVRVTLQLPPHCRPDDKYEALFQVACWPGTPPSLCKPGIHRYLFSLPGEAGC